MNNNDSYSIPKIKDLYPEVKFVHVSLEIICENAAAQLPKKENRTLTLTANDPLFCHLGCINPTCTGTGFDLTPAILSAIRNHRKTIGELKCNGKETNKYRHSAGNSCMTKCKYHISAEFL